ncbi:unnamed protein product [Linum trigynum]|uniref:Uncharacterized protein n=1 Tax=Linum trigynum TaxID=586398 RepID=A0AAV2GET0_9ROSI
MLSLTGNIKFSSLFPQYLITAILVGVCAVTIRTHFSPAMYVSMTVKQQEENSSPTQKTISQCRPQKDPNKLGKRKSEEEEEAQVQLNVPMQSATSKKRNVGI